MQWWRKWNQHASEIECSSLRWILCRMHSWPSWTKWKYSWERNSRSVHKLDLVKQFLNRKQFNKENKVHIYSILPFSKLERYWNTNCVSAFPFIAFSSAHIISFSDSYDFFHVLLGYLVKESGPSERKLNYLNFDITSIFPLYVLTNFNKIHPK